MNNQLIIEVLEHLDKHIIYDANIKEICYSGELIKVKNFMNQIYLALY